MEYSARVLHVGTIPIMLPRAIDIGSPWCRSIQRLRISADPPLGSIDSDPPPASLEISERRLGGWLTDGAVRQLVTPPLYFCYPYSATEV